MPVATVFLLDFAAFVSAGPVENGTVLYNDGVPEYNRNDYATALKVFRPLACKVVRSWIAAPNFLAAYR